ncbi:hypothetical protein N9L22_01815 [Candidatus Poseidonia alphae]|nr:hypothetical protein [Candidatus Poseidonia alphae]
MTFIVSPSFTMKAHFLQVSKLHLSQVANVVCASHPPHLSFILLHLLCFLCILTTRQTGFPVPQWLIAPSWPPFQTPVNIVLLKSPQLNLKSKSCKNTYGGVDPRMCVARVPDTERTKWAWDTYNNRRIYVGDRNEWDPEETKKQRWTEPIVPDATKAPHGLAVFESGRLRCCKDLENCGVQVSVTQADVVEWHYKRIWNYRTNHIDSRFKCKNEANVNGVSRFHHTVVREIHRRLKLEGSVLGKPISELPSPELPVKELAGKAPDVYVKFEDGSMLAIEVVYTHAPDRDVHVLYGEDMVDIRLKELDVINNDAAFNRWVQADGVWELFLEEAEPAQRKVRWGVRETKFKVKDEQDHLARVEKRISECRGQFDFEYGGDKSAVLELDEIDEWFQTEKENQQRLEEINAAILDNELRFDTKFEGDPSIFDRMEDVEAYFAELNKDQIEAEKAESDNKKRYKLAYDELKLEYPGIKFSEQEPPNGIVTDEDFDNWTQKTRQSCENSLTVLENAKEAVIPIFSGLEIDENEFSEVKVKYGFDDKKLARLIVANLLMKKESGRNIPGEFAGESHSVGFFMDWLPKARKYNFQCEKVIQDLLDEYKISYRAAVRVKMVLMKVDVDYGPRNIEIYKTQCEGFLKALLESEDHLKILSRPGLVLIALLLSLEKDLGMKAYTHIKNHHNIEVATGENYNLLHSFTVPLGLEYSPIIVGDEEVNAGYENLPNYIKPLGSTLDEVIQTLFHDIEMSTLDEILEGVEEYREYSNIGKIAQVDRESEAAYNRALAKGEAIEKKNLRDKEQKKMKNLPDKEQKRMRILQEIADEEERIKDEEKKESQKLARKRQKEITRRAKKEALERKARSMALQRTVWEGKDTARKKRKKGNQRAPPLRRKKARKHSTPEDNNQHNDDSHRPD